MENLSLLLIVIPVLTTLVLVRFRKRNSAGAASQSRLPPPPPSPPCLPIIGHLHYLGGMPHHNLMVLAQKVGPIIGLRLGRVPTVVVSSPQHAALILKTHDHVFASRPQLLSAQFLSFSCSDVTFSPYGPYWRQARKICVTELLSQKRVSSFKLIRDEETNRMICHVSDGEENDVSKMAFAVANDVLCRVAFGKRFLKDDEGEGQDSHFLIRTLAEAQELFGGFCVGDFFPEWTWLDSLTGFRTRCRKNLEALRKVCDEIIEEHLKTPSYLRGGEDFVDVLLRVQKRDDLEVPITDDNLKALVLDMFVAGTDTTSAVIEWTMTHLIRNPTAMKKAQEEVRKHAYSSTDKKVSETNLQNLHYLRSAIKEAMRLTPPVPLLVPRESMEDCVLDGFHVPAKTRVLINTYAIGRDAKSWPGTSPTEFDPNRFNCQDGTGVKGQDFRFLPFGGGRRGCPGFTLGLATVELALARLLCHFDWALPRGATVDLDEVFGLAIRKKNPLVLVPTLNKDFKFEGSF